MTTSTRRRRVFRRRILTLYNFASVITFLAMLVVAWLFFTGIPSVWGALLSLFFLALAAVNLISLLTQPRRITLEEKTMRIRFLFGETVVPFERIERLHWRGGHRSWRRLWSRDVLRIELKNGRWITIDHLRGQLRTLRASLEKRIYG